MARRTLASFRLRRGPGVSWAWAAHLSLALSAGAIAVLLWIGPQAWGEARRRQIMEAFNAAITHEPVQVGAALEALPDEEAGFPEDPTAVRRILETHPLIIAALSAKDSRALVREGRTFREEQGTPRVARWRAWAKEAVKHRGETIYDPDTGPDEPPTFLLVGPEWRWIVQWRPGTPEAEAFLRLALGPHPRVRAGLALMGEPLHAQPESQLPPAFRAPNLQTSMQNPEARWTVEWTGTVLGPHWESIFQPWPEQARAWEREVRARVWLARLIGLGVVGLLALGMAARRNLRRQEALEADRLAALTHSLKTPLAIHKLRCDSLRVGSLDPSKAAEELMKLGQDVDDLVRFIERGLLAREQGGSAGAISDFGPEWLEDVVEGLRPAVEDAGRTLVLQLSPQPGRAHLPSLESGLLTLLENAYYYGRGTITLRSAASADRLRLEVWDEGPGLDSDSLEALGRPFQRVRAEGEEGFRHEGQGLGLSLLIQVARQEGWGLDLRTELGQGFHAGLEVPLGKLASSD
jgi:signal transduction histidine kinase